MSALTPHQNTFASIHSSYLSDISKSLQKVDLHHLPALRYSALSAHPIDAWIDELCEFSPTKRRNGEREQTLPTGERERRQKQAVCVSDTHTHTYAHTQT